MKQVNKGWLQPPEAHRKYAYQYRRKLHPRINTCTPVPADSSPRQRGMFAAASTLEPPRCLPLLAKRMIIIWDLIKIFVCYSSCLFVVLLLVDRGEPRYFISKIRCQDNNLPMFIIWYIILEFRRRISIYLKSVLNQDSDNYFFELYK